MARGIWTRRNAIIHGEDFDHHNAIVRRAVESLDQFRLVQDASRINDENTRPSKEEKWMNPPSGRHKANWDIAIDTKQKRMGLGVIIRDEKELVTAALSRTMDILQEPTVGEAMGALGVAEFSKDIGISNIILEGDFKQVVEAVTSKGSSMSKYGHIIGDIHEVLKVFRRWDIRHVKRIANEATHVLAKSATKEIGERIWLEDTPNIIFDVVTLEQFALSV